MCQRREIKCGTYYELVALRIIEIGELKGTQEDDPKHMCWVFFVTSVYGRTLVEKKMEKWYKEVDFSSKILSTVHMNLYDSQSYNKCILINLLITRWKFNRLNFLIFPVEVIPLVSRTRMCSGIFRISSGRVSIINLDQLQLRSG